MRRLWLAILMVLALPQLGGSGLHVVTCMPPERLIEVNGQPVGMSDAFGIIEYCVNDGPECVLDSTGILTVRALPEGPSAFCEERPR